MTTAAREAFEKDVDTLINYIQKLIVGSHAYMSGPAETVEDEAVYLKDTLMNFKKGTPPDTRMICVLSGSIIPDEIIKYLKDMYNYKVFKLLQDDYKNQGRKKTKRRYKKSRGKGETDSELYRLVD